MKLAFDLDDRSRRIIFNIEVADPRPMIVRLAALRSSPWQSQRRRGHVWGQGLEADLSSHLIAISTDFTGTEVVLFGAIAEPGDVAVVVEGAASEQVIVRRKAQVAGVWMNRSQHGFRRCAQLSTASPPHGRSRPSPMSACWSARASASTIFASCRAIADGAGEEEIADVPGSA